MFPGASFTASVPAALPSLLADATLKATAILALALLVAWNLRRCAAATRHLLWALSLCCLLALPCLTVALPSWTVPINLAGAASAETHAMAPPPSAAHFLPDPKPDSATALPGNTPQEQQLRRPAVLVASRGAEPTVAIPPADPALEPAPPVAEASGPARVWTWIAWLWLGGAAMSLVWMGAGSYCLAGLARRCQRVIRGPLYAQLQELAAAAGLRRAITLLLGPAGTIPMTWGLRRPVILLPQDAVTWSAERLRMVLVHELGHVLRWDCMTQMLGHLARGLYWFHPLAWWALAKLRAEQENACDDLVLRQGAAAPDYAEHLVAVTTGRRASVLAAPVALGMARSARLRRRLLALLDPARSRTALTRRKLGLALLLAIALLVPAATLSFGTASATAGDDKVSQPKAAGKDGTALKKLAEVQQKLRELYVAPLDEKQLAESALKGLLRGLKDPYVDYLPPAERTQLENQLKARLSGIGAQLRLVDQHLTVLTPLEDSPALKAGLRPGDRIEAIDGKPAQGLEMADAIKRILGPAGTQVKLKIVHPEGVVEEVAITRADIQVPSLRGFRRGEDGRWVYYLDPEHKVAYVQVLQFSGRTAAELREALQALQKKGLRGLILDLRSCPGGLLAQAVNVCKLFLKEGTILTTRGAGKQETIWKANGKDSLGDFPVVVLINEQTASAAEIVAGALGDHKRAILLGTRTYGKGSVQAIAQLADGGALKVTTAFHYLPSGRNIQKRPGAKSWGVDPSDGFYIPLTRQQTEALQRDQQKRAILGLRKDEQPSAPARLTPRIIEEQHADPQLAAALRTLVARLTGGEFIKVGKSQAALESTTQRLEEMRRRREALLDDLGRLDREIIELQQAGQVKGKQPKD
jgi:carboxyl-terminal processing protease